MLWVIAKHIVTKMQGLVDNAVRIRMGSRSSRGQGLRISNSSEGIVEYVRDRPMQSVNMLHLPG